MKNYTTLNSAQTEVYAHRDIGTFLATCWRPCLTSQPC